MTRVNYYGCLQPFSTVVKCFLYFCGFVFCMQSVSQTSSSIQREIPEDILAQTQKIANLCKLDSLEEQMSQLKKSLEYLKTNR